MLASTIITHSLGARVALGALNILGDFSEESIANRHSPDTAKDKIQLESIAPKSYYQGKIDNLFMWEAAVADNALSNIETTTKNPISMHYCPVKIQQSREAG